MYSNISIYFSSDCPHSCVYCSINKNRPCAVANNKEIRESMLSGEFAKTLINKFSPIKERIDNLSLWGMEPTVNTDQFENLIVPLLDYFTNVHTVMFSTNSWLGWERLQIPILVMQRYNKLNNRSIHLDIQISLDGPEYINDPSRRIGATKRTLQVIEDIILKTPKDLGYPLRIFPKPTVTAEWYGYLGENPDKLFGWYKFFDDIHDHILQINNNPHIEAYFVTHPTVVNPGEHTQEDGKAFAKFIRETRKLDISELKHYKHPLITQQLKGLQEARGINSYNNWSHWGCCSSGRYTANIDHKGNLFTCHALFDLPFIDPNGISATGHTTLKDKDAKRLQRTDLMWMEYPQSRYEFVELMILSLAKYGQIDEIYLHDKIMRKALYYSLGGVYCQIGVAEVTKSHWVMGASQLKFFGNGALQEIVKYLTDIEKGEYNK